MLAAETMGRALVGTGLDTVFANPGTTELHLVEGFAKTPGLRQILTLFEGVASGAADGYARMTGRPAAALLHLGPGLGNALANLHNARRAHTPVVAIVGDHATAHRIWDAPLQSDIAAIAGSFSIDVRTSVSAESLATDARASVEAAVSGRGVATLIVPADHAWGEVGNDETVPVDNKASIAPVDFFLAAKALRSEHKKALVLGGAFLSRVGTATARAIAEKTDTTLICETFLPRIERGAGDSGPEVLPYFGEMAKTRLSGFDVIVLVGAQHPAGFFAYPGQDGDCAPPGAEMVEVALTGTGLDGALCALAAAIDLAVLPSERRAGDRPSLPEDGPLSAGALGAALAALLPENAIVSDEANTTGPALFTATAAAAPHDWLRLTGGAIGQGLPLATGAAVACPDRRVIALQSDGSALYTLQALWTQARERLKVTTVLLNNGSYAILRLEMMRLGLMGNAAVTGPLFDLGHPPIDFVSLAHGFGVEAVRARTVAEFAEAFARAVATPGPMLIDAVLA